MHPLFYFYLFFLYQKWDFNSLFSCFLNFIPLFILRIFQVSLISFKFRLVIYFQYLTITVILKDYQSYFAVQS
jgi:hypothetical protein